MKVEQFNPQRPGDLIDPATGWVNRRVFVDDDIHAMELERVFAQSWLFVGHESEVAKPGDYVTRTMGDDPVILSHSSDGQLRVFLNACPHRGALVCRADAGNSPSFICPYHGWTFRNDGHLHSLADKPEAYKNKVNFDDYNLVQARVGVYAGLIFATFNEAAPDLETHLGNARWYIDMFFNRTPNGAEVLGAPVKWVANMNWKYGAINFAADGPHALAAHGPISRMAIDMPMEALVEIAKNGPAVRIGNGHGCIFVPGPPGFPDWTGFDPAMVPLYEQMLSAGQQGLLKNMFNGVMTVFPNLSWVHFPVTLSPKKPPINFFNMRVWQPTSAHSAEIWAWFIADKESADEYKEASLRLGIQTFTGAGTFDQDDSEAWASMDKGSRGTIGRQRMSSFQMILASQEDRIADFPGPGEAYHSTYSEMSEFGLLLKWREMMQAGGA